MTPKRAPKQVHAASTPRRYRLYVIELGKDPEWVYVGETALAPRDRLRQHREGYKSSRVVRRLGGQLRRDLSKGWGPYATRAEALASEEALAEALRSRGFR